MLPSSPKIRRRRVEMYSVEALCGLTLQNVLCDGLMQAIAANGTQILHRCTACGKEALYTQQFPRVDSEVIEGDETNEKSSSSSLIIS